ncbi:MAG: hypothetical protein ABS99_05215 [Acetobacteraceae bacterium SCN 69-10]|nr:MAG: hypothetical protein ABS99_05215 [Acetobacteraceae bacterium SCN 69-10]OJY66649.1 MAG: hypothetical protein BGP12_09155 [Rhodospirillales bacterium 70-18]
MKQLSSIPPAAGWLGFSGLLPFAVAALAALLPSAPLHASAQFGLVAYGAAILSFLGGVRWGLAMAEADPARLFARLGFSVLPSLVAWVGLLVPVSAGLVLLAVGFALMLMADVRLAMAPDWYRYLRLPLSAGAICALTLGLFA